MQNREPVAIQGIVQALVLAVLALGEQFNVFKLTEGQVNAVLGFLAVLFLAYTAYTRSKVTPV